MPPKEKRGSWGRIWEISGKDVRVNGNHRRNMISFDPKKTNTRRVKELKEAFSPEPKMEVLDEIESKRARIGQSRTQRLMDLPQGLLFGRGVFRGRTRELINTIAENMLTGNSSSRQVTALHEEVKSHLRKNPNIRHVRIRKSRRPLSSYRGDIVVEALDWDKEMAMKAKRHYEKEGYTRHRSGEGDLILSREDVLHAPLANYFFRKPVREPPRTGI